ncbi:hypothetical protein AB32_3571 [Escherichia coli 2-316-03_S1_C2]|nr:hypothetical protein [Escherichia coli]EHV41687.1 hypothetical protein ECDEC5E_5194 [Escherichia coli DEC5E]EHW83937.1 hypothetical protein ECDEC10E_5016 [Escherichia coli DEC10E]EHX72858.1 hypothetical protein ECDEC14B_5065 [Escherichia coli DEC14B]EHX90131.1 hypothetical protein ECDEC14D_3442 [Escherichia coli DEC14D]ENA09880.1 hypothetical protein ECP02989421_4794 [Escherichia coli P0298942.1]ENB53387.1 hypothetical protein ECP029894212_4612 [Escherichia coli P0298942.12]ENB56638.1 hyp
MLPQPLDNDENKYTTDEIPEKTIEIQKMKTKFLTFNLLKLLNTSSNVYFNKINLTNLSIKTQSKDIIETDRNKIHKDKK